VRRLFTHLRHSLCLLAAVATLLGAAPPQKVTLQLKWLHSFQFAGYYAALAKGFYQAEGLEVTLREADSGLEPLNVVMGGQAEFGVSDMQVFHAYEEGQPLVALGVVFQHSPYVIIALRKNGITRPSDLAGRTVMFSTGESETAILAMLESEGIPRGSVKMVTHSFNLSDLVDGKVDAISAYITDEPFQLEALGVEFNLIRPSDYGIDYYGDLLFTTQSFAGKNPNLTERFSKASFRGWEYAMEHTAEVIDLILALPGVKERGVTREKLAQEANAMRDLVLPGLVDIGHMNPRRFERIAESSVKLGLLKAVRDPGPFMFKPPRPMGMAFLKWVGFGVVVLMLVGIFGSLWILQLRRQVASRTLQLQQEIEYRLEAERSLAEREQRFRLLVENLPAGAVYIDQTGFYANHAVEQVTGYDRTDLIDIQSWEKILDPEDAPRLLKAYADINAAQPVVPLTVKVCRRDGSSRIVEISMRALPTCEVWLVLDVTSRFEAEAARLASEDRYRGIYLNSSDFIKVLRVSSSGEFLFEGVNPSFAGAFGLNADQVVGKPPRDCLPTNVADLIVGNLQRCVEAGRNLSYEEVLDLPSGKRILLTQLVPIRDPGGRIYLLAGISRDLTEERRSEEVLRQAQKLESLGVLAGGIAHDFNNLLSAILGNLNLAQLKLAPDAPSEPYLKSAESTILRAADLARQMLAYSGKGRFVVQPLDLSHLVGEITHLLTVSISKKVVLRYDLKPDLPAIEADASQVQQVIMNLVTNASEAIGDKEGIIALETGTRDLDQKAMDFLFAGQELEPGKFVTLQVSDTGCGMSPATVARIFDPFFTTKASGRGLGLSAMLGILRGHRAGLKIYSELGKGSTFQVYFRASGAALLPKEAAAPDPAVHFEGKVLLVDDEPDLRESISGMLEHLGFEVESVADGQEALDRFRPGTYTLVLMDLTMPRMDGKDAFRKMKAIDPGVRVILSSGYNEQDAVQQFLGRGLAGFIQKPYQLGALVGALEKALRSGS
jgi:PAS domain S-box-containing protein